ncbi:MAG: hypothetical protein IH621_04030 [Krumholzibacteria bacterium]|nr:hypothetical protein [Candidatus Krumholzibacteria bacterium]
MGVGAGHGTTGTPGTTAAAAAAQPPLGHRQIFAFYWPLVLTSQMMTVAHPIINAGLGRSDDAIVQLAAYGVGFGLAVFLNSPLFPFQQVVAAMGTGPRARRDLITKGLSLGLVISGLDLLLALTPAGDLVFGRLIGSTPAVAELARGILLVQAPIPLLLPLRALAWGMVLRHRDTRIISQATGLRLILVGAIVFGLIGRSGWPPAIVGGAAMTAAVLLETVYSGWRAWRLARRGAAGIDAGRDEPVSWRPFLAFIGPLMVSTVTWSAMRPLLNAVMGRTADPDLAQGGLGFVFPLLVLMASPLWALQNTTLVLLRDRHDLRKLLRFATAVIALFVVLVGAWVWTPLRHVLLRDVFSLPADKAAYVTTALLLIPYHPLTMGLRSISQGFLMNRRRTGVIAAASLLKALVLVVPGFALVAWNPTLNGALLATALILAGDTVETAVVGSRARRLHRELMAAADGPVAPGTGGP